MFGFLENEKKTKKKKKNPNLKIQPSKKCKSCYFDNKESNQIMVINLFFSFVDDQPQYVIITQFSMALDAFDDYLDGNIRKKKSLFNEHSLTDYS